MTSELQYDLFNSREEEPAVMHESSPTPDSNEKPALILLDGMALVYRSYYGLLQARMATREGVPTGAVYGFMSTLLKIIETYRPEYLAVAFDSREKTFRHDLYDLYKANRQAPPEDLLIQLEDILQLIRAFGIPVVRIPGYEADDLIGTAAGMFEKGCMVYIVTPDKDMVQLVHDGIKMLKPGKKQNEFELMGIEEVRLQFGVTPEQFIDLLTLTGDTSDNIPGAKGIGPKTATALIGEYGSLDNIYHHLDKISPKTRRSLEEFQPRMPLIRELVTIRRDLDIPLSLDELRCGIPDRPALIGLLKKLELNTIAARIPAILPGSESLETEAGNTPLTTSEENPSAEPVLSPASEGTSYTLVDNEEALALLLEKLKHAETFAVDTETTSLDTFAADLAGISFSFEEKKAFFVYFGKEGLDARKSVALLKPALENPSIGKTGQNLKFDILVLKKYGVELAPVGFDTMIASYVLDPESRHNMDDLAAQHLGCRTTTFKELVGEGKQAIHIFDVPPGKLSDYACQDADIALRLQGVFNEKLGESEELLWLCRHIEFPLVSVLADMEHIGISIDTRQLAALSERAALQLHDLSEKIHDAAGVVFNIDSPKQLANILFNVLKLPAKRATKTGFSTNVQILEDLAGLHPVAKDLLEYRSLQKLKTTYIDALPKMINPLTGRLHTSFNQQIAATGRLSSSNPNLQNIPIRTPLGKEIRSAFIPSTPGNLLLSADYSQIELRIAAELSGDPQLIDAFRLREDIHAATARVIFNTDEVTSDMRRKAKEVNFGVLYGIMPFGLAQRLNISQKEASTIIETYKAKYPGIFNALGRITDKARTTGYVTTMLGRRRYIANLNSKNGNIRMAAERVAMNAPIQGTAADIIKYAMCTISRRLKESRMSSSMLLQVHDELLFETTAGEQELLREIVEHAMIEGAEKCGMKTVPVEVQIGTGKNWLEAH